MSEHSELVKRLRANTEKYPGFCNLNTDAAEAIERLEKQATAYSAVIDTQDETIRQLSRDNKTLGDEATIRRERKYSTGGIRYPFCPESAAGPCSCGQCQWAERLTNAMKVNDASGALTRLQPTQPSPEGEVERG